MNRLLLTTLLVGASLLGRSQYGGGVISVPPVYSLDRLEQFPWLHPDSIIVGGYHFRNPKNGQMSIEPAYYIWVMLRAMNNMQHQIDSLQQQIKALDEKTRLMQITFPPRTTYYLDPGYKGTPTNIGKAGLVIMGGSATKVNRLPASGTKGWSSAKLKAQK